MGDLKFLRKLRGYDARFAAVAVIRSSWLNAYYRPKVSVQKRKPHVRNQPEAAHRPSTCLDT